MITSRWFTTRLAWSAALLGLALLTPAAEMEAASTDAGSTVAVGSGPFDVSGEPSSYALAWVDSGSGAMTLSLFVLRTGEPSLVRPISADVDPHGRVLLKSVREATVVAWKAGDGWRLGRLTIAPDGEAVFVETALRLPFGAEPLAMSSDGRRVFLLLSPVDQNTIPQDRGTRPRESGIAVVEIPVLHGAALVVIDLDTREARVLHRVETSVTVGALGLTPEGVDAALVDGATGRIEHLRLDPTGAMRAATSLGWAAAESAITLAATEGATRFGWTEDREEGSAAVLARADRASTEVVTEVVSSPGIAARGLVLSEGAGNWAAWSEVSDRAEDIVVGAWDDQGNPACRTTLRPSDPVERTWLLSHGEQALLFVQSRTPEGPHALKVVTLTCDALSAESETRAAGVGVLSESSGDVAVAALSAANSGPTVPESPFGGASEPCDGYDNDGNGVVDDGCDLVCDAPRAAGPETRVTNNPASSEAPWQNSRALAWTGSEHGVVWHDWRDGNAEIYFARLNASGAKIGTDVRVTNAALESGSPTLAWTGSQYGVTWNDRRDGNYEIYFTRLDAAGNKVGGDVRITNAAADSLFSSLVWTGSDFGVSWVDTRDGNDEIYFARIDATGKKIGADVRVTNTPSASNYPSLVWTGREYGVAWQDARDGNTEIYFGRLDSLGVKIGADARVTSNTAPSEIPSLVSTERGYGVSWQDWRDGNAEIYFARLGPSGDKIGSDVRVTKAALESGSPSLYWTGSEYGVSWNDRRDGNYEIYFIRIDATGMPIDRDLRLTNAAADSMAPYLVWTGSEYDVAWQDARDGNTEIYFARIGCCDDADADGYSECAGDTNDQDPTIHPGALEVCDGFDNDSDGATDEGCDAICDAPQKAMSETRVTNNPASSEAPWQNSRALAWTGSEHGVVWHDWRDGNAEIYFARLNASGVKIGTDVRVTNAALESGSPTLAWTGSQYGVTWNDRRDGNYEIYFTRLDAAGNKVGSDVRITNAAADSLFSSLVWTGSVFGVSWVDTRDGNEEIYFARIDATGNKIGADVRVTNTPSASNYPSLVWTGSEYGVAWQDARDGNTEIYFARIDSSGVKIGADARVTSNTASSEIPSLVSTGSGYGVSWQDWRDGNAEIYFARLGPSGDKIGSDVRVTNAALESGGPSLIWTGSEYGVAWNDRRDGNYEIYFVRIDATGRKIDFDQRVTIAASDSVYPYLVWTGTEHGVAWQDARDGNAEIYFARIGCCDDADGDGYSECAGDTNDQDPTIHPGALEVCDGFDNDSDGTIDEGCDTTCDTPQQAAPETRVTIADFDSIWESAVWTGSEYGIAWSDYRDGNYEIYFTRLDAGGRKIGSDVRLTSDPGASGRPSLVWTGHEYGVVWDDTRDRPYWPEIYFARLDAAGNKIGSDIRITNDSFHSDLPNLVWTGREYGVVWRDDRDGNREIYFARIDSSGMKLGNDIRVTTDPEESGSPSLVWMGNAYGVAWWDLRDNGYEIYFASLDAAGRKIVDDVRVTNDPWTSLYPRLVWNGGECGVAWYDNRDGNYEIYFARMDAAGNKNGSDVRVTNAAGNSDSPSLVWTGSEYGVSWNDDRGGDREIYFARIDRMGGKIGSDVRVTNAASDSAFPSLVWTGSEYGVSWYDGWDGSYEIYFARIGCCDDADGDGYSECAGDTNDQDPTVHPGATELCDGFDNDSDGTIDEGCNNCCDAPTKAAPESRITSAVGDSVSPSLAWDGAAYGSAWQDARDGNNEIYFARFDASGAKTGADVRVTADASDSREPSLAWTGGGYGVAWQDFRNGNNEIYFARFDAAGVKVGSDVRVTNAAGDSVSPSLAWTGTDYAVAWHDARDGNYEIYFARIDAAGNKIGSDSRLTNAAGNSAHASLAWSGNGYGVSWQDERDGNLEIYVAILDSQGAKVGSETRLTSQSAESLQSSLVWTGSEYGLSWLDRRDGNYEIYFARTSASGVKIGSDVRVTNDAADSRDPSLVWSGCEYAIAWHDLRDGNYEAYFTKLDASGNKVGTDLRVTNVAGDSRFLSALWTGSEYGMSWQDARDGNNEIYFARLACAPSHQNICGGEFVPLADAFVDAGSPGANFGGAAELRVGSSAPGQPTQRALLQFDLGGTVSPGSTIHRALLQLRAEQQNEFPYGLEVRSVTDPWNEATVTWSSQPAYGASYGSSSFRITNGIINVDVTDLVTHWVTGRLGQTSLALNPAGDSMDAIFVSREGDASGAPGPKLIVSCSVNASPVPRGSLAGDAAQQVAIDRLRGESQVPPTIKLSRGAVRFATFQIPVPVEHRLDPATRARWFLSSYRDLVRLEDPGIQLQLARRSRDGQHLVFRQRHDGVPVHPAELIVHLQDDDVTGLTGSYSPDIALTSSPQLTAAQATRLALADAGVGSVVGGDVQLRYVDTRLLGDEAGRAHLTWQVPIMNAGVGGEYFIDALDGLTVHVDPASYDAFDLTLNSAQNTNAPTDFPGCWAWQFSHVRWFDEQGLPGTTDPEGNRAFDSVVRTASDGIAQEVLGYWWRAFGRDSYDDHGGQIGMYLDVGHDFNNRDFGARYREFCNVFEFQDTFGVLDVVAHEFTHAVIRNEAWFEYENQSGSLSESYADVFAFMVDSDDFTIGEDVTTVPPGIDNPPFRDLSNPPAQGDPDHVDPALSGERGQHPGLHPWVWPVCDAASPNYNDCGNVHHNSGIPNKAAYLMIAGGPHNGYNVHTIGRDKTARLLYIVLSWGLTPTATFDDLRDAAVKQAELFVRGGLFQFTAWDVCQVRNAYASVGIGSGDADCDGVEDNLETDDDSDGIPDTSDNCPAIRNSGQGNLDGDAQGDACDNDIDGDGVLDDGDYSGVVGDHLCTLGSTSGCDDNCRYVSNPFQQDTDRDGISDACDDSDGDSIPDSIDNCRLESNRDQGDLDGDRIGDACDPNMDGDQWSNFSDNCPSIKNNGQENSDGDRFGDACDLCLNVWNVYNDDCDGDGLGNDCDPEDDKDGIVDEDDNCPCTPNPNQADLDGNGIGLACDDAEQESFFLDPGPLREYHPIKWPVSLNIPFRIGVAVCPACAGNDLPEGFVAELNVQMAIPFRARIVDGSGNTRAWGSDAQTVHRLRFQPESYGSSRFDFTPRVAATGGMAGIPEYVAPDQVRYLLELFPAEDTDRTQEYTVSVEHFQCEDADGDGFGPVGGATCPGGSMADCDDADWRRSPGRAELCDNLDNNCDGGIDGYVTSCGVGSCGGTGICSGGVDTCTPGQPSSETCDGQDNDCNGAADDVTVSGQSVLHVDRDVLSWSVNPSASGYDVVRGNLRTLRVGGDFTAAAEECLGHEVAATSMPYSAAPAAGEGYWFLVRGAACNVGGTYDSGASSQSGSRDAEIEASTVKCGDCPHSRCATGGPMMPSCDACTSLICDVDPHCCSTAWDETCVAAVRTVCDNLSCGESTGACTHSLCAEGPALTAGCDSPPAETSCVAAVCAVDSFCCSATWDATCVGRVSSVCGKQCG